MRIVLFAECGDVRRVESVALLEPLATARSWREFIVSRNVSLVTKRV